MFLQPMNNAVFSKTMEKFRKHHDIKLVKKDQSKNYLISEPNLSHNSAGFRKKYQKLKKKTNKKAVYLGSSILNLSKIETYEI